MSVVTVDVRRLAIADVPSAVLEGRRQARLLRRDPRVQFARLVGTAGPRFTVADARPSRWALLVSWADEPSDAFVPWTRRPAREAAQLIGRPLSSRGRWDGRAAFDATEGPAADSWRGPLVVLTRSTLRLRSAAAFYRRVPRIATEIALAHPLVALGIGEAPLLRQGTLSVWESSAALARFHRESPAHRSAIEDTARIGWYAEELFVRMALVEAHGSIDGVALG